MSKKLYRSSTNKVLAGVCGGIGEYFNVDPVIIRLLVIVFTLMGGSGFVVYLIAYVIIPPESAAASFAEGASSSGGNRILRALLLIIILIMGMALLAIFWSIFRWSLGIFFGGGRFF